MEEGDEFMKDVIVKLLGFYVKYRVFLNDIKKDFWQQIDWEWFHKPVSNIDLTEYTIWSD